MISMADYPLPDDLHFHEIAAGEEDCSVLVLKDGKQYECVKIMAGVTLTARLAPHTFLSSDAAKVRVTISPLALLAMI